MLCWLLCCALLGQTADPAARLAAAGKLMGAGKTEEAAAIYRDLARVFPNNAGVRLNAAVAEYKLGRYREAVGHSEAALELQPDLAAAHLFLGAGLLEIGEVERAVAPLRKAAGDRNGRLMLAEALHRLDRCAEAAGHFEEAVRLLPDSPRTWSGLASCFERLGQQTAARLDDPAYRHLLEADAAVERKLYARAFYHFRQALELPAARAGLAALYRVTGHADWAAAVEAWTRPPARQAPTLFLEAKSFAERAAEAWRRLEALPPSPQKHQRRAREHESQGLYSEAVKEWRQAAALEPRNAQIRDSLALALYHNRDYGAALPLLEEWLRAGPASAQGNFLYGASLLNLEQPEKAVPFLETAVRLDAAFLPARAALGHAYLRLGDARRAIPHLAAAAAEDDDGSRHYQLARAYQLSGEREAARQALARYRALDQAAAERREEVITPLPEP